jgi:hypothetical protein
VRRGQTWTVRHRGPAGLLYALGAFEEDAFSKP